MTPMSIRIRTISRMVPRLMVCSFVVHRRRCQRKARRPGLPYWPCFCAFPTGMLTCPIALLLTLRGLLRGSVALRPLILALGPGGRLLMLRRPPLWLPRLWLRLWRLRGPHDLALRLWRLLLPCLWLRLWRLRGPHDLALRLWRLLLTHLWLARLLLTHLWVGCRPSLLNRVVGGRGSLNVCAPGSLRLRAGRRRSGLLEGMWRAGSALALLRRTCLRVRRCLPHWWRRRGRSLRPLRLKLLPHDRVARLVAVMLALEDLLLRRGRISIP